jgi:cobalt transporter subunit CbtB
MQSEIIGSRPRTGSPVSSRSDALVASVFAALLGGFLIWGVGFSHIDVIHNAAPLCCTDRQADAVRSPHS